MSESKILSDDNEKSAIEKDSSRKGPQSEAREQENAFCPFSQIPASVWEKLYKKPFRKRHPVIFWSLLICAILFILSFFTGNDNEEETADKIALVKIEGPILDSEAHLEWIYSLSRKKNVKGILVRVNSPGGGAAASQEIYEALKAVGKNIPVVVSMGATAASGGLMISMAGERIYANPSTITGSIGVRMDIPQLQGLMEKIGIGQETLVSGPYKNTPSYTHPMSPADKAYLQEVIDNMYEQFVQIVASARKMDLEQVKQISNGKIYTGQQALKLGLIDELGTQEMAYSWLCKKTSVSPTSKLLEKKSRESRILKFARQVVGEIIAREFARILQSAEKPEFFYK